MKVVIIEDEVRTANDLAKTLHLIDDEIEILTVLYSSSDVINYFKNPVKVDLIFSDIDLGDGSSLYAFSKVEINVPIIFITAYDEYALEAFDSNGIAYILKPFSKQSIEKALEKYQSLKSKLSSENDFSHLILQMEQRVKGNHTASVIVQQGEKIIPLRLTDVAIFYTEGGATLAFTSSKKIYPVKQSLDDLEGTCGNGFFRASRQFLVSRMAITDASHYFNRKLLINLSFPFHEKITVSKLKSSEFISWLAQG